MAAGCIEKAGCSRMKAFELARRIQPNRHCFDL